MTDQKSTFSSWMKNLGIIPMTQGEKDERQLSSKTLNAPDKNEAIKSPKGLSLGLLQKDGKSMSFYDKNKEANPNALKDIPEVRELKDDKFGDSPTEDPLSKVTPRKKSSLPMMEVNVPTLDVTKIQPDKIEPPLKSPNSKSLHNMKERIAPISTPQPEPPKSRRRSISHGSSVDLKALRKTRDTSDMASPRGSKGEDSEPKKLSEIEFETYQSKMSKLLESQDPLICLSLEQKTSERDQLVVVKSRNSNRPDFFKDGTKTDESATTVIKRNVLPGPIPSHVIDALDLIDREYKCVTFPQIDDFEKKQENLEHDICKLEDLVFEVDKQIEMSRPRMSVEDRGVSGSGKKFPPVDNASISKDISQATSLLETQPKGESIINMFEDASSINEARRVLQINHDSPDLLLNQMTLDKLKSNKKEVQLLFSPIRLEFDIHAKDKRLEERIICSAGLFYVEGSENDMKATPLSETFKFDIFNGTHNAKLEQALFTVSNLDPKIYLLMKFSRVFKGEETEEVNDFYVNGFEKYKQTQVDAALVKLKVIKQEETILCPFGWSATSIVDVVRQKRISLKSIYCKNSEFGTETQILKSFITKEVEKDLLTYKPKNRIIKCILEINVTPITKIQLGVCKKYVSASYPTKIITKGDVIAREIASFESVSDDLTTINNYLYIYPRVVVIPLKYKYKNIMVQVEMKADDKTDQSITAFFDPFTGEMKNAINTEMEYKNYNPFFTDEIKCRLPTVLSHKQHLLFKFYHVNHKAGSKTSKQLFGFSFLRISDGEKLNLNSTTLYQLPLYLATSEKDLKYLDGEPSYEKIDAGKDFGKNVFGMRVKVNSTLYTENVDLDYYFAVYNKALSVKELKPKEMIEALKRMEKAFEKTSLINYLGYFNLLVNQLLSMLEHENEELKAQAFKSLMVLIEEFLKNDAHKQMVAYYVKHMLYFESIDFIGDFLTRVTNHLSGISNDSCFAIYWFFYSVLLKSMALWSSTESGEFPEKIQSKLVALVAVLPHGMLNCAKNNEKYDDKVIIASREVGSFCKHLFSFLDRGFVMSLAETFINGFETSLDYKTTTMHELENRAKIIFFDELFRYKNYPLLFLQDPSETNVEKPHYIYQLFIDIFMKNIVSNDRDTRLKAITVFRDLIHRMSADSRFASPELQLRINALHFGLFSKFMDGNVFHDWRNVNEKKIKDKEVLLNTSNKKIQEFDLKIQEIEAQLEMEKEKKGPMLGENNPPPPPPIYSLQRKDPQKELAETKIKLDSLRLALDKQEKDYDLERRISRNEKRHLFVCFIHLLEGMKEENWENWLKANPTKLTTFFYLLDTLQYTFEYAGKEYFVKLFSSFTQEITESGHLIMNVSPITQRGFKSKSKRHTSGHYILTDPEPKVVPPTKISPQDEAEKRAPSEKNLAHRAGIFVFTFLYKYICKNETTLFNTEKDIENHLLTLILKIFNNFLNLNQSEQVMMIVTCYLKYYMNVNPKLMYAQKDVTVLVSSLLNLCQYKLDSVRKSSVALFYLTIKNIFLVSGGIAKPKLMATRSLSALFGTENESNSVHTDYLLESLEEIVAYAKSDPDVPQTVRKVEKYVKDETENPIEVSSQEVLSEEKTMTFVDDIEDLCFRLKTLIKHIVTVWHEEHSSTNPYKIEELLIRISEGYAHIPELRCIWLEKLAEHHIKKKNNIEAAQCYLRVLGTIFELLQKHPQKCEVVKNIPIRYLNEIDPFLKLSYSSTNEDDDTEENQLEGGYFEEESLIALIQKTCDRFEKGEFWENAIWLYKIMIAFYERSFHYVKIADIHEKLKSLNMQIHDSIRQKSRFFPSYYRIRFYGAKLGELDEQDFVYKLKRNCKLFEVVKMVKEWLKSKGEVQLISHSDVVDKKDIDHAEGIYAQITFLNSYLNPEDPDQTIERKTQFQKNTLLDKFYNEVPYRPEGWKKDYEKDITKQYKKRTIITVQHHFPYMVTRLSIADVKTTIMDPIEAATEVIQERNSAISEVLLQPMNEIDLGQLQLQLSGAVQARVNGGPRDIVQSFLDPNSTEWKPEKVRILNDSCIHFLQLCNRAINEEERILNSSGKKDPKQFEMHGELLKGFKETKELLNQYLKYEERHFEKPKKKKK